MTKDYELVADVASYQPDTLSFFKALAAQNVRAVIVKLTEGSANGSAYVNPKAAAQLAHARAAGLLVHAYHYAKFKGSQDASAEAAWFVQHAQALKVTPASVMVLDIEDQQNANWATADANTFLQAVKAAGYPRVDLYSMASWFWSGRLDPSKLLAKNLWVANYGVTAPGVADVGLWQYTNSFEVAGLQIDMSYDFNGFYSKALTSTKPVTPSVQNTSFSDDLGDKWTTETGIFTTKTAIKLRWGAKTTSSVIALLPSNSVINYDAYSMHDGFVWLRQPRSAGKFGYLASGEEVAGRRTSCWGEFESN
ncbi:GH25 family lysozyme [Liquorilactobacillus satsumensis]|uniref:GH25 family lysozyme n=1 Tax=Liquorilactobacillus TaxID=2767888 RepID=UPI0021C400FE|nr:GH25 family lysozyme [Liquorilactobacillus satsumensis]MCP9328090.1 hypothetical protein [Liquorilactobacillus satsumensis]